MEQIREVAGAVQVALQRVREELAALEREVTALTNVVGERGVPIGAHTVITEPIRDALEETNDGLNWDEVRSVMHRELWLPEFGALLPPDEQG